MDIYMLINAVKNLFSLNWHILIALVSLSILWNADKTWLLPESKGEGSITQTHIQYQVLLDKQYDGLSSLSGSLNTNPKGDVRLLGISLGESGKDVMTELKSVQGARQKDISLEKLNASILLGWHDKTRGVFVLLRPPNANDIGSQGYVKGVFYSVTRTSQESTAKLAKLFDAKYPRSRVWDPDTLAKEPPWCVPIDHLLNSVNMAQLYFVSESTLALEVDNKSECR